MKTAKEYREQALDALRGNWKTPVLFCLIYMLVAEGAIQILGSGVSAVSEGVGALVTILVALAILPMGWAFAVGFLTFFRTREEIQYADLFTVYKREDLKRICTTLLLQTLYIVGWTLLLIVPGLIKSFSYAMVPYILHDDPEISNDEAIERSMKMMEGHKMELFCLEMSFAGWMLLAICFTLGIGLFWVMPYMYTAMAAFYEDLKAEQLQSEI